jgi:hypothetical protein
MRGKQSDDRDDQETIKTQLSRSASRTYVFNHFAIPRATNLGEYRAPSVPR